MMDSETLGFIRQHRNDDVRALALQAGRYPAVDMPAALVQIAGWQAAREKLPAWAATEGILYPAHLSLEQCSSERTARYKAEVVGEIQDTRYKIQDTRDEEQDTRDEGQETRNEGEGRLVDLTGGFGIDCAFLAPRFRQVIYVERQEALCAVARHNFPLLGLGHVEVHHADAVHYLEEMDPVDWIFIDPARRDGHGGKTVAIADCEPDVSRLEELLLRKARRVLVKLSPMLDLSLALGTLKHVQAAHVVSVAGECKELLLLLGGGEAPLPDEVPVCCVNLGGMHPSPAFRFTRREEKACACPCTARLKRYLYEPNASILKAGAFRSVAHIYKVEKLHANSHLYTSDEYLPHFPGRKFRIEGCYGFNKKELKGLALAERRANLAVRNFPAGVSELRKRLKISEGGSNYLFATTLADERKVLISAVSAVPPPPQA